MILLFYYPFTRPSQDSVCECTGPSYVHTTAFLLYLCLQPGALLSGYLWVWKAQHSSCLIPISSQYLSNNTSWRDSPLVNHFPHVFFPYTCFEAENIRKAILILICIVIPSAQHRMVWAICLPDSHNTCRMIVCLRLCCHVQWCWVTGQGIGRGVKG